MLPYVREPRCFCCGRPLENEEEEYCPDCSRSRRYFEQGRSLYLHRGMAAKAVYRFKFKNQRGFARIFAHEMAVHYGGQLKRWEIDALIPVPLYWKRKRQRGYNQAELLARQLSKETGIRMETGALFRIRKTMPQKELDQKERAWNLKGAFAVSRTWKTCNCALLLDDIYTTGNTINQAAKMLKKAGVQKVYFLSVSIGQGL